LRPRISISEFLHPLKKSSYAKLSLAAMYFAHRFEGAEAISVEEIKGLLKKAQLSVAAKSNIAAALSKSAPHVEQCGKDGAKLLWRLTSTGEAYVRELVGLPVGDTEVQHDVSTLGCLASKIKNSDSRTFVEEAILCLKVGALRATMVFLWAGAMRITQERMMKKNLKSINASIAKYISKPRVVKKIDDLSYFKEKDQLLVAQDLGLFDKNQRSILESALDLRNKCGHPGKYAPGEKKVSSFIEDIISTVF